MNQNDIIKVEAKGSYAVVYLAGTKIISTKLIKDFEVILWADQFIRVHNTWLVNTNHLKKYYRGKNSYMEMDDGSTVPVSARRKSDFLDKF